MPVITVEMFEGRSREQRRQFSEAVTDAAVRILKTEKEHVWMIFRESPKASWSMGGKIQDE